jgi:hypothetical protein
MKMTCANKDCGAELKYLRGGRLFFMERQISKPPTALPHGRFCAKAPECPSFEALPETVCAGEKRTASVRRYFWLCENCAQAYTIRRWTEQGIELIPRQKPVRMTTTTRTPPPNWILPGLVG